MMRASRYKFGSVPDVYVIREGTLKGFVSISPTWRGIDSQAFLDISRQVYEEDEFEDLLNQAAVLNGEGHSNIISMSLNDYRVPPGVMFMTRNDPQLTLGNRSLKLNRPCWERLGKQQYIEFLYHPILEMIAVRNTQASNPNAVLWNDSKGSALQLSSSAFSGAIFDKLNWMKKYRFRFRGVTRIRDRERIVFFYLDEPQILVGKAAKDLNPSDAFDSTAKFIPYKESENNQSAFQPSTIAYPENWQQHLGVSYEIQQKRDALLNAVSAADISNRGTKVVNPFIGVIPPANELEEELERLYQAM